MPARNEKPTLGVGTVQPCLRDQFKDGRKSSWLASYNDPSPSGGGNKAIYKIKKAKINAFLLRNLFYLSSLRLMIYFAERINFISESLSSKKNLH